MSGRLIGLLTGQNPHVVVGMLGILKSGNGFVPLDPNHPDERLEFVIKDCDIEILITEAHYLAQALRLAHPGSTLRHIVCLDPLPQHSPTSDTVEIHSLADSAPASTHILNGESLDNPAYVIYTSGSTGMPKGVVISHRSVFPIMLWGKNHFSLDTHTQVLQTLNHCFDFGVFELFTALIAGGCLHFLDPSLRDDFANHAHYINTRAINTIHATPTFFKSILSAGQHLPTLRNIHLGGEALTPDFVNTVFESVDESCAIHNGYGPTEASINCSIHTIAGRASLPKTAASTVPIGRTTANNRHYILDPHGNPVPAGVPGELYVGGPALAHSYLHRPALTAERFLPDPFSKTPGARMYRTGDLVRFLHDGNVEFLGRMDHQVKIRGLRIELGEIEAVLTMHPAVKESLVMVGKTQKDDPYLVAYLILNPATAAIDADELRRFLREKLPSYMVPSVFVTVPAWPLTSSGKIDRKALPQPDGAMSTQHTYVAPRTPTEEKLAEIWQYVLKRERIGVHDDFFALGGHSLLATQVVSRIRQTFGVELPLTVFFDKSTMEALAQIIDEKQGQEPADAGSPIMRRKRKQAAPQAALENLSDEEIAGLLGDILAQRRNS